jgi:hypothetical protein
MAAACADGKDAPIPDLRALAPAPGGSTHCGQLHLISASHKLRIALSQNGGANFFDFCTNERFAGRGSAD